MIEEYGLMDIPAKRDWENRNDDLDTGCAFKQFGGKSLFEAVELFAENALYYQEDLQWMPKVPFQFYVHAFKEYLLSEEAAEDSDAASCFLRLIKLKLETDPEVVVEIFDSLLPSVRYVAENQKYYDADIKIYGDFQVLLSEIFTLAEKGKT
jgi:hypothetical protein